MKYDDKFRLKVAKAYIDSGRAAEVANQFNVKKWSVYRWGRLYRQGDEAALKKKSRKPKTAPPLKTDEKTERLVCKIWFGMTSNRNYTNVSKELQKMGVKKTPVTIKAIIERRKDLWPKKN